MVDGGIIHSCKIYLEPFISCRMFRITGDDMGETRYYQLVPLGLLFTMYHSTAAPLYKASCQWLEAQHTGSSEKTPPLLAVSQRPRGGLLSSSSHFYWQQLPGKSWAANVDSSKKFLVKKHTAFLVSTQGNSPPHKACGYIIVFYFFICGEFCPTLKWNSYGFTCVPHPDPPSTSLSTRSL